MTRVIGHPRLFATAKVGTGKHQGIEEQLAAAGFPSPELEVQFASHFGRKWAFDYAWVAPKIALEIEGGGFGRYLVITSGYERRRGQSIPIKAGTVIRAGGRHNTGPGMIGDIDKYNTAQILGWLVVRASGNHVRDGSAIATLQDAFRARGVLITPR